MKTIGYFFLFATITVSCNSTSDKEQLSENIKNDTVRIISDSILFLDFCIGMSPVEVSLIESKLRANNVIKDNATYLLNLKLTGSNERTVTVKYNFLFHHDKLCQIVLEPETNLPKDVREAILNLYTEKYGKPQEFLENEEISETKKIILAAFGGSAMYNKSITYIYSGNNKQVTILRNTGFFYELKKGSTKPYEFTDYYKSWPVDNISEITYTSKTYLEDIEKQKNKKKDSIYNEIELSKKAI